MTDGGPSRQRLASRPGYEAVPSATFTMACRAVYGAALLAAPAPVLTAVTGTVPSARARRVTRLLGARHLAQAAISVRAGGEILMLGAVADGLHAVSMLILAATDEQLRRAELGDAVVASLLAATWRPLSSSADR